MIPSEGFGVVFNNRPTLVYISATLLATFFKYVLLPHTPAFQFPNNF
jgi:hypothetical protein